MTSAQDVASKLSRRLVIWGGGSVVAGAAAALVGPTPAVRAFGVQSAGWGAIDLAIAGIGVARSAPVVASTLRKTLWINTGLDVVYMALGAHVMYHRPSFGGRISPDQAVGHGAAVVVQGGALLVLDSVHARQI
ncbi:MAG: hypothetical protein WA931_09255 [Rhodococcus sp. (in: high G+C Gram-positive bacteria)]